MDCRWLKCNRIKEQEIINIVKSIGAFKSDINTVRDGNNANFDVKTGHKTAEAFHVVDAWMS